MYKKILITGASGFAGSHLAEYLIKDKNISVYGTYLSEESLKRISYLKDLVNFKRVDLTDEKCTFELLSEIKPDFVYHLAALSSTADSFKDPFRALSNNISAQINLLESIKRLHLLNTRILVVSSSDAYGIVAQEDLPINENTKFMPNNAYAVSKITQDFLGLQYFLAYNLNIVRVRPFNHIGPRQSPNFVVSAFAKQITEIEKGIKEPIINVGNLEARRDFTDVRDIIQAYTLILEQGTLGEVYNIGSGVSYKISEIMEKLISLSKTKIVIKVDKALLRPSDIPELRCDSTKVKKIIDWSPTITIETSLKDTLDYWRSIV